MKATVSFLFLLLFCSLFWAQEVVFEHYQSGTDIWVLIPYSSLSFKKGFDYADYQLSVEIKGAKKKEKTSFASKLHIPKRDWLQDAAIPVKFTANLVKDNYKLALQLRNLNLGDKVKLNREFSLDKYTPIGQAWLLAEREEQSFLPADLGSLNGQLSSCVISQKFSLALDSLSVEMGDKAWVYHQPREEVRIDLLERMPVSPPINITVHEANIQYKAHPFTYSPWFAYNLRYSYSDQVQQIRYIATQNQYHDLMALKDHELARGIELFWQSMDPSPGTIRNEAREEFCNRVIIADERYTLHKKLRGWASDRGRIYIKFGEPDYVSHPDPIPERSYPTIVWSYKRNNKEFLFVELSGYGQYTLWNKDEEYD